MQCGSRRRAENAELRVPTRISRPGFRAGAGSALLIAAVPAAFALLAGIDRVLYAVFDCDLYYIFHAVRFNQGLPQAVFDHTGYLYMLVLSWWTSAFHHLGLVTYATLEAIRGAPSGATALSELITAGRLLSIVLTAGYAIVFAAAARRITGDRLVGLMLGILIAASPGIGLHAITLRPELLSGFGVMAGFLAIALSRQATGIRPYVLVGLAATAVYLGHMSKTQAIIPALLLPLFGIAAAPRTEDGLSSRLRFSGSPARTWLFPLFAAFVFLPVLTGHIYGTQYVLDRPEIPPYLWIVAGWVVLAIVLYNYIYRKSGLSAVYALSAICVGLALAYAVNAFHFSLGNIGWSTAFIENMKRFTPLASSDPTLIDIVRTALDGVTHTISDLFTQNVLWGIGRALVFGAAIALAIVQYRRGQRLNALVIAGLCIGSVLVAVAFSLRGFRIEYGVYFYFMPVLAIALGYADLDRPGKSRARTPLLILLAVIATMHLVGSYQSFIAEPYRTAFPNLAHFCAWQLENAPFFPDAVYSGERCWAVYQKP